MQDIEKLKSKCISKNEEEALETFISMALYLRWMNSLHNSHTKSKKLCKNKFKEWKVWITKFLENSIMVNLIYL